MSPRTLLKTFITNKQRYVVHVVLSGLSSDNSLTPTAERLSIIEGVGITDG